MKIEFFHECTLPTTTAQQQSRTTKSGKHYKSQEGRTLAAMYQAIWEKYLPGGYVARKVPYIVHLSLTWPHTQESARRCRRLGLSAVPRTEKPDCGNAEKAINDAGTKAGVWPDDKWIVELHVAKYNGDIPGMAVCVLTGDDIEEENLQ